MREYWEREGDIVPTLVMVYQERAAFSKGDVPFPSSRWRFYNIHPTCTHVEMVIFVSAFPLPIYLSLFLWQRRKIPWQRLRYRAARKTTSLSSSYRSGMLSVSFVVPRPIFDPSKIRVHTERDIVDYGNGLGALMIFQLPIYSRTK